MSETLDQLLAPISQEMPCGEDLSYDPQFQELGTLIMGKQETQFSAGEEPDWKSVRKLCITLFEGTKDLRVAVNLALANLKIDGMKGFAGGLGLLKGLLETYWESFYPRLDPEDNNDPLERMNIIAAIATPAGTFGDPLRFIDRLRETPLCESPQMGRYGFADVEKSRAAAGEGSGEVSPGMIDAAFRDTPAPRLQELHDAVAESLARTQEIDDYVTRTVGVNQSPTFKPLLDILREMKKCYGPYLAAGEEAAAGEDQRAAGSAAATAGGKSGPSISGRVQSRQDVIRVLDQVVEYYRGAEPASPVPFILQRARRMVDMDFMQIVNDLTPEAMNQVMLITGGSAHNAQSSGN